MAGLGLGLLVVPLINVVLVAVPADLAGSASGLFSTAQQSSAERSAVSQW